MRIRNRIVAPRFAKTNTSFRTNRSVKGLRIGIRADPQWQSWLFITKLMDEMLTRDGAARVVPITMVNNLDAAGEQTRSAFASWAQSLDYAVVGLGN